MIMKKIKISLLLLITLIGGDAYAQDIHFNDVTAMGIWYNQSLKTDRKIDVRLAYRDVRYERLVAFQSAAAMVNLPLMKKERRQQANDNGFLTTSIGAAYDQSNNGIYKNNIGLLGLSYAQRLSADQVYLSAGFQGTFTQYRYSYSGTLFPDQFGPNGPTSNPTTDPSNVARSFSWFSLNAGLSLFKTTEAQEWYLGVSLRHANQPFTDQAKTATYRLARTWGTQAGVTFKNDREQIALYGVVNLKAKATEYLVGAKYTKTLNEIGFNGDIGFGLGYRVKDAIIPNLRLRIGKSVLGLFYDKNISGIDGANYTRKGLEISLIQQF
jgi:type IX secretion system PorP/SprF family membrane protein